MDVIIYLILFFMGVDRSKPLSSEVPKLIKLLGDDEWEVREAAQRKLEKMGPEIYTSLEKSIKKEKDLEVRSRCYRIIPKVLNVFSDDKDNLLPSIYYIPNVIRFPKGYDCNPDNLSEWSTKQDIAKTYFEKARNIHKVKYSIYLDDDDWRDEFIEKDAMQLFMRDLRIKGVPENTCKRILNWSIIQENNYQLPYVYKNVPGPASLKPDYRRYPYQTISPDGNWREPITVVKWLLKVKNWPTSESVWKDIKSKLFPDPPPIHMGNNEP